ncbi:MAG TPA: 7-cyano-7-deazaguanine synthase [Planctomycetota bacterium]|nr:7-cyano-7-deazaguanine synthase [Planctomycetota bacterium]
MPKIREELLRDVPDRFCDLLEIATYVYVADQAATRGGDGVENVGEDWYRNLFFRIPVRHPEFWSSPAVTDVLTKALSFLSDDHYQFDFVPLIKPPKLPTYFDFGKDYTPLPHNPDVVMLFSGGLDSLAGAIQESVLDSRKVALVMHRSTEKFARRHVRLVDSLKARARYQPLLFPIKINKRKHLNHEYTQRTRSLLYVTLGAIYAEMFRLPDVRFYENGVTSLNLPLATQAVSARSSRTTHPQVMNRFEKLISLVADRPIRVLTPFVWKTKQDVVELIKENGFASLIQDAISCSHAAWHKDAGKTHCGTCSQCIDRRFAVLAAGAEEHDPGELYSHDLLVGPRSKEEHRLMIASYVSTAEEIVNVRSPQEFFAKFGMACRALEYFEGRSVDSVAQDIYQLHKRHAAAIIKVIDSSLAVHARGIRGRQFPADCLIRLVSDSGDLDQKATITQILDAPLHENTFKRKGNGFIICFAGGTDFMAPPAKGIIYLHKLFSSYMAAPTELLPMRATELALRMITSADGQVVEAPQGDAGEVQGEEGETILKARLYEIDNIDLPMARRKKEDGLVWKDELIREKLWIEKELRRMGRHGNRREKADRDRVRNSVSNNIKYAIEHWIAPYDKRLADHLQRPRLKKGYELWYMPGERIEWDLG